MRHGRRLRLGGAAAALVVLSAAALALAHASPDASTPDTAGSAPRAEVPLFVVDPLWPDPLPTPYILGSITGVAVDARNHIYIVNHGHYFNAANEVNAEANPPTGECCIRAPGVVEYNADGMVIRSWGAAGQGDWPLTTGGIGVDPEGNVWIGGGVLPPGAGRGGGGGRAGGAGGRGGGPAGDETAGYGVDTHILKFTREGRYLATIGLPRQQPGSTRTDSFGGVARFGFDAEAGEVYVADGYANRRVVVLDMRTGQVKRFWGAYGNPPDDSPLEPYDPDAPPARQFRTVTCAVPSRDGFVYVCDRGNNRIQVFRKDGTFVREQRIMPRTLGQGSVWDAALSHDPQQRFLYVADGMNERVHVLDRATLEVLTSFGTGGRYPSHFMKLSSIAVDSDGNVYTGEDANGKRVQKFLYQGMGEVNVAHQGAVWPTRD